MKPEAVITVKMLLMMSDYYYFSTNALQPSRLIVPSGLDVLTFATKRLHASHHARAPSGGRWNCGQGMSENFA
jgi:hypothetical protein